MSTTGPSRADTRPPGRIWKAVAALVNSPWGLALAFIWGLAEALSWPIMAEMTLVFFAVAVPRRIWVWAGAVVVGSVTGVISHAWLTARAVAVPTPWTTESMFATAHAHLLDGPIGIINQALNGIPVKVYAQLAGQMQLELAPLALWTLLERGARMGAAAVVLYLLARLTHRLLRRYYGPYLLLAGAVFALALSAVIRSWS